MVQWSNDAVDHRYNRRQLYGWSNDSRLYIRYVSFCHCYGEPGSFHPNDFCGQCNDVLLRRVRRADFLVGNQQCMVERGNSTIYNRFSLGQLYCCRDNEWLLFCSIEQHTCNGQSDSGHTNDYGQRLDSFL